MQPCPLAFADALDPQGVAALVRCHLGLEQVGGVLQDVGTLALEAYPVVEAMQGRQQRQDVRVRVEIKAVQVQLFAALRLLDTARSI